jgi:hypothetical protein
MLGKPGPCGISLVHAHVDPMRLEDAFDQIDAMIDEFPEGRSFFRRVVEESRFCDAERGQEMTVGIGKSIQHQEAQLGPVDDQRVLIKVGVLPGVGDEVGQHRLALRDLRSAAFEFAKIGHSPWGPEVLMHARISSSGGVFEGSIDQRSVLTLIVPNPPPTRFSTPTIDEPAVSSTMDTCFRPSQARSWSP